MNPANRGLNQKVIIFCYGVITACVKAGVYSLMERWKRVFVFLVVELTREENRDVKSRVFCVIVRSHRCPGRGISMQNCA